MIHIPRLNGFKTWIADNRASLSAGTIEHHPRNFDIRYGENGLATIKFDMDFISLTVDGEQLNETVKEE